MKQETNRPLDGRMQDKQFDDRGEGCSLLWPCSFWLRDGHALIDGIDDHCQTNVPDREGSDY